MAEGENKDPQGQELLQEALAEFESHFSKANEGSTDAFKPRRGANQVRGKSVLGRGLSALMSVSAVEVEPSDTGKNGSESTSSQGTRYRDETSRETELITHEVPLEGGLAYLPIERIEPNPNQPRQSFNKDEIEALTTSIQQSGLLQPIILRRKSQEAGILATYEIVAGERRWRAAKAAGLSRVPAIVRQLNDKETLELSIVENIQRSDLNPIEEAFAYQRLITEFGATQEEVAKSVGKDRSSIANSLRLLKLAPEVLGLLRSGQLSAGHGRALLMAATEEAQIALAEAVIAASLSVRDTEHFAVKGIAPQEVAEAAKQQQQAKRPQEKDAGIAELEERLRRSLGTKVKLVTSASGKGELRIAFFSQAELDSLLERLDA